MRSRARPTSRFGFVVERPVIPRSVGGLRIVAIAAVLVLAACEPGSDLPLLPETSPGPYRLGVGDRVRVITFGDANLTGEFRVNDRGNIAVPLLGNIRVAGLTTAELETRFADDLEQRKILNRPSVAAEIVTYRPIFILGEVAKPGQYPYQPDMTVLTAVAIAGGFTYRAQTKTASILRHEDGRSVEGRVGRGTTVYPGDIVDILPRYF